MDLVRTKIMRNINGHWTETDGSPYAFKTAFDVTIDFRGRVYSNKIPHPSGNGTMSIVDGGKVVYYPKNGIGIVKAAIDKEELKCCPNCGQQSIGLYMTESVQPSTYYEEGFHYYYQAFCPVCMIGSSASYAYDATSNGPFADWAKDVLERAYEHIECI